MPASNKAQKILGSRFRQRCDLRRKGGVIKGSHTFFLSAFTKSSHTCTHIWMDTIQIDKTQKKLMIAFRLECKVGIEN